MRQVQILSPRLRVREVMRMNKRNHSDWYFNEAVRQMEKARNAQGQWRFKCVLRVMFNLTAYIVGRSPPPQNAITCEDDPVCDRCFKKVRSSKRYGYPPELCKDCETDPNKLPYRERRARKAELERPCYKSLADDPEHEKRIVAHEKRIEKEAINHTQMNATDMRKGVEKVRVVINKSRVRNRRVD